MAPAPSPTGAVVRVLPSEASHGIAVAGQTLIVLWKTETSARAVRELATLLSGFAAERGQVALLQVIGDGAISPDAAARSALANMLKENEARLVASAVVYEGSGFRASMIRSIVIGISMLSRHECPHTVFASVSEGVAWLTKHLGERDPALDADGVREVLDQLRQQPVAG